MKFPGAHKGDLVTWCLTFSHMLISGNHLGLEPGDCTSLVKGLGWFELMALPNVHRNLTVPTPADSVLVYVLWLLASEMHNLIRRKVAMHTSLSPMKLFTTFHPHPPRVTTLTFRMWRAAPCTD